MFTCFEVCIISANFKGFLSLGTPFIPVSKAILYNRNLYLHALKLFFTNSFCKSLLNTQVWKSSYQSWDFSKRSGHCESRTLLWGPHEFIPGMGDKVMEGFGVGVGKEVVWLHIQQRIKKKKKETTSFTSYSVNVYFISIYYFFVFFLLRVLKGMLGSFACWCVGWSLF